MGLSNIQWTTYTFNAWLGCRKIASECVNCYITSTPPFRFRELTHGAERVRTAKSTWRQPLAWNKKAADQLEFHPRRARPRVFCLSLGDWLDDENVPIEWLADLTALIHQCKNLDFLLLTKRPQNWRARMEAAMIFNSERCSGICTAEKLPWSKAYSLDWQWLREGTPPENVWIGVSAGADQAAALDIPAKVHFLSVEPMLHPLDTTHAARFDWHIYGGESGAKARPCNIQWIREGVKFCADHKVKAFVKQLGAKPFDDVFLEENGCEVRETRNYRLKDSHGGDPSEWPDDLRIREFPEAR